MQQGGAHGFKYVRKKIKLQAFPYAIKSRNMSKYVVIPKNYTSIVNTDCVFSWAATAAAAAGGGRQAYAAAPRRAESRWEPL